MSQAPPVPPALAELMRRQAQENRERMTTSSFTKGWSFTGKNAIVEPGADVIVRLLPRWDYADSIVKGPDGKVAPNPAYDVTAPAYVAAYEHWWQADGKWHHEWCPRTYNEDAPCPICFASVSMLAMKDKADRDFGKKIQAQKVFIFNAVVGDPRVVAQDGLVDIRILPLSRVQFNGVSDVITGGDKENFARGLVYDPREGYDLSFKRPMQNSNDRWTVQAAVNPTPLYGPDQKAAFVGWVTRLVNLEEMLDAETKDYAGIFKSYFGKDPGPGDMPTEQQRQPTPAPSAPRAQFATDPSDGGSAAPPEAPDDDFMPPAAGASSRSAAAPLAATAATAPAAQPASPGPAKAAPRRAPRR